MPQSKAFSSICPSIDYGKFHAYSGGGKVITGYGYHHQQVVATPKMIDTVYACTMCGACDTACKTNLGDNVEPFDTILELRARMASDGKVPPVLGEIIKNLEREGSPSVNRSQRSRWAEGLNIPDARTESVEVLLHAGSENTGDESQWQSLRFIVALLKRAKVNFGIVYEAENDSGGLAYELGFQELAATLARDWRELLCQSQAHTLLVAGAHDYSAFRNIYPRLGLALDGVRVVHITEYIEELLTSGRLSLDLQGPVKVAYHDSCRLGRRSESYQRWEGKWIRVLNTLAVSDSPRPVNYGNSGNYEAPRHLLSRINGLKLLELERNRQFSYCCGGSAGVREAYPEMADMAALNCLREAESVGAAILVTGSSCCQRNMAAAATQHNVNVKVTTVFDLLADSMKGAQE